jgi:hypothetical protein
MDEEARFIAQPTTPKSERLRSTWGSLEMSIQTVQGLCPKPRCVFKENHSQPCWPTLKEN